MLSELFAAISTPITYKYIGKRSVKYLARVIAEKYAFASYAATALSRFGERSPTLYLGGQIFLNAICLLWYKTYLSEMISSFYASIGAEIETKFPSFYKATIEVSTWVFGKLEYFLLYLVPDVAIFISDLATSITNLIIDFYGILEILGGTLYEHLLRPCGDILLKVPGIVEVILEWVNEGIKLVFENILMPVKNLLERALSWFEEAVEEVGLEELIKELGEMCQEIKGFAIALGEVLSEAVNGLIGYAGSFLDLTYQGFLLAWLGVSEFLSLVDIFEVGLKLKYGFEVIVNLEITQYIAQEVEIGLLGCSYFFRLKEWEDALSGFFRVVIQEAGVGYEGYYRALKKWWDEPNDFNEQVIAFVKPYIIEMGIGYLGYSLIVKNEFREAISIITDFADLIDKEIIQEIKVGYEGVQLWWEDLDALLYIVDSAFFTAVFVTIFGVPSNSIRLDRVPFFESVLFSFSTMVAFEVGQNIKERIKIGLFGIEEELFNAGDEDIQIDASPESVSDEVLIVNATDSYKALADALLYMLAAN